MKTYIALLRGVNVGGKRLVPMARLRECLSDIGLKNVRTYIQSGNVVFESGYKNKAALRARIQRAIEKEFRFSPAILLLSRNDLREALSSNPFAASGVQDKSVHLFFLASVPEPQAVQATQALAASSEDCEVVGQVFYLSAPDGVARSKIASRAEKSLGVDTTARNLRSAKKILDLADRDGE